MTTRSEFSRTRKDGRAKSGRLVIVSTLADDSLPHLKVGVITTRRIGKAHDRNRLRRRVRAIIQRHRDQIGEPLRYLVTIPRPGAVGASFADLEADWLKQARRLRLMPDEGAARGAPN